MTADVWRVFIRGGIDPNTNQPAPGRVFLGNEQLDLRIDKDTYLYGVYYGLSWSNTPEETKGLCLTGVNRGGSQEWDGVDYGGWDYLRSVNYDSQGGWSRGRSSRCASIS